MHRLTGWNEKIGHGYYLQCFEEPCLGMGECIKESCTLNMDACDRLAQYENLGLEPSQIAEIDRLYQSKCEEVAKYRVIEKRLKDMFGGELPLEKYVDELELALAEPNKEHPVNARILTYEDAEKWDEYQQKIADGRMVELPCKVGDTVYTIDICFWDKREKCIGCTYFHEGSAVFRDNDDCNYSEIKGGRNKDCLCISESKASLEWIVRNLDEFGKTVFLTKEEAEQALKESGDK